MLKVVFRVDASIEIGNGHLMRCLTLANALSSIGAHTRFISRQLPEHLHSLLRNEGHEVIRLVNEGCAGEVSGLKHSHWLGIDQSSDANETIAVISDIKWDWIVVDHYGIDHCWETQVKPFVKKIMVIDDLVDREHNCDLLLDQTLGRTTGKYMNLVPSNCLVLTGATYSLLRPEFAAMRDLSLKRRENFKFENLLITMGGVDHVNATGIVLEALKQCELSSALQITVVMGAQAPWLDAVISLADSMPWSIEVKVNVNNMAELMTESDLIISAAGSSSWERCCLGVPGLTVVIADNQQDIAVSLENVNASLNIGDPSSPSFALLLKKRLSELLDDSTKLQAMGNAAAQVTAGDGVTLVLGHLV